MIQAHPNPVELPALPFAGVLYGRWDPDAVSAEPIEPGAATDIRLDQVVTAVTLGRGDFKLDEYYLRPLRDPAAVRYRQAIVRDLERPAVLEVVRAFAAGMRSTGSHLATLARVYYRYEQERWFLDAAIAYCRTVRTFAADLGVSEAASDGLRSVVAELGAYLAGPAFTALEAEATRLAADLNAVRYRLQIHAGKARASLEDPDEPDYSVEILETFERFRQGTPSEYSFDFSATLALNHVEAGILDRVAQVHPEAFGRLLEFRARHADFIDPAVARFDREIQFYVAWLEHIGRFRSAGLRFSLPELLDQWEGTTGEDVFDLALARTLLDEASPVVANDFRLEGEERLVVVTGPNQGGKTTFARTIGQLHHLAALGLPVPGAGVHVRLADRVLTHFDREEVAADNAGKLEDDLVRLRAILATATPASVVILNESFSSTTLEDARYLSAEVLSALGHAGPLCVFVTFIDELASLGPHALSMVSAVDPDDPARRTFRLDRRPADGLAYAMALAEKHGLTRAKVRARIAP